MSVWGAAIAAVGVAVSAVKMGVDAGNASKASKQAQAAQAADANARAAEEQGGRNAEQNEAMLAVLGSMIRPQGANGDQQYMQLMGYDQGGGQPGGQPQPGEPAETPDPSTARQRMMGGGGTMV